MDFSDIPKWLCVGVLAIAIAIGVFIGLSHGIAKGFLAAMAIGIFLGGAEFLFFWIKHRE
jgi:putative flippase GtrA